MDLADLVHADGRARKAAKPGALVTELKTQGAVALDDAALKALIVGKATWIRNNVTGGIFRINWTSSGRRLITNVDGRQPLPGEIGDVLHSGEMGSPSAYAIKNGQIVTTLGNQPYEVTVYKLGDKYLAARSNEFGFANYEVVAAPSALVDLEQVQRSPFTK